MSSKLLEPNYWSIGDLVKNMYEVPVYQRPYSWDKDKEVYVLLEDIYKAFIQEPENGFYLGNIIIYEKEKFQGIKIKYDIIDGQQRITTLSLILLAIYSILYPSDLNKSIFYKIKEAIWKENGTDGYSKNLRLIYLNNLEKEAYNELFDLAFDKPNELDSYSLSKNYTSIFEKKIITNFEYIKNSLKNKFNEICKIENFAKYILDNIKIIAIEPRFEKNKVFSIFESINSKGKKLENIDIIKTYIFSQLNEADYEKYVKLWGDLIIETNDNLYDYLFIYICANIKYYTNSINIDNFKIIVKENLNTYFNNVHTEEDFVKHLMDDLKTKLHLYKALVSSQEAVKIIKKKKFKFYYRFFIDLNYKHPRALFFKMFEEYENGNINEDDITDILIYTLSFMIKFLTIGARESKDNIAMFSGIMNKIFDEKKINKSYILKVINTMYQEKNLVEKDLEKALTESDAYNNNKKLTYGLLALYETKDEKNEPSFDEAYAKLETSNSFSLDHLLVQTPEPKDINLKYRNKNEKLELLEGHDFPINLVRQGMNYEDFKIKALHRIGNLSILAGDKNSRKQNSSSENFNNFLDIVKRGDDIANFIFSKCLPKPDINTYPLISVTELKKRQYPRIDTLMDAGLIKKGDLLFFIKKPDKLAKLLNKKEVEYKGEKMTLNQWAEKISGWGSINVYDYIVTKKDGETLGEKRKYINNEDSN